MALRKETEMSAKTLSSLTDNKRDLRKQIGCMNGIFQLFDRHHFLTARRINSHNHKRLLLGAQHHLDPKYAPKVVIAEELEVQKEKPRVSMESSRPSYSSSSCSSTFSSLDCNRTAKPEALLLRQINMPQTPLKITAMKEQKCSLPKGLQSLDLQDALKDSMYKQANGLSVKPPAKDEIRGHVMKHIDSPRPLQQSKYAKPKATGFEGSTRVLAKLQDRTNNSKDERLALPRFSYDGRESRETFKSTMKLKELPRLSLDSKASSNKCSAFESRLNFLGRDLHVENEKSSQVLQPTQEPGSHNRSSSVVAKLMGLEAFPDTIATDESGINKINTCPKDDFLSRSSSTSEKSRQNQISYSPRFIQKDPASQQLPNVNSVRKPSRCSRFPMEPAPWRQQDSSQVSPKLASQIRKAPTTTQHLSSSVYGEIEKRITELEFKRSGKDLRAFKQILETIQKTRERLGNQRGDSVQFTSQARTYNLDASCSDQNSSLSMWHNRKSYCQAPTINGPSPPKRSGSSIIIMKPAKVMDRVKLSSSTQVYRTEIPHQQRFQNWDSKHYRDNSAHIQAAEDLTPRNNDFKVPSQHDPSIAKKITRRTSEVEQTSKASPRMRVENCTTSGRSFGNPSPRLPENPHRIERQSNAITPSLESGRVKKHSNKKVVEKGSKARRLKVKSSDLQLSDDQLSELSSETRYSGFQGDTASVKSESNISITSQMETEVIRKAHSINTNTKKHENSAAESREHMPTVELVLTMLEQPSPVSVLDATFYGEDSPSPVKKISTAFREDESSSPDEAEWHLKNLKHLPFEPRYKYNEKKLENIKHLNHEFRLLNTKSDEAATNHIASVYGGPSPDHRYINKIILTSGLLKDVNFIPTADQLHSSCHLIKPNMFHVLEQTKETLEGPNGDLNEKNDWIKSSQNIHRKIVFDVVNEIFVRKITSDGSFTPGMKRISPQVLIKQIYLEVDRLQRKPDCNLDEEDDGLIRILTADMIYRSEDWADYSFEVPALVLDIERLIFKDLINEVVTSEVMGLHDWPKKHCRQLFTK